MPKGAFDNVGGSPGGYATRMGQSVENGRVVRPATPSPRDMMKDARQSRLDRKLQAKRDALRSLQEKSMRSTGAASSSPKAVKLTNKIQKLRDKGAM